MPNHITNIIEAAPHVLEGFMRQHTEAERIEHEKYEEDRRQRFITRDGDDSKFVPEPLDMEKRFVDFGTVVPMPDNMETGGCPGGAVGGIHADGTVCWYQWNSANWGTKWSAYDQSGSTDDGRVQFDTAWSHPFPVLEALSKKFPNDRIRVRFADEDLGNNLGEYVIQAGELEWTYDEREASSEENLEFAAQIKYGKSYAELRKEWDADEIEGARTAAFARRIEALRGVQNGYRAIRDEGLEVPQDIIDAIQTIEQAENYQDA